MKVMDGGLGYLPQLITESDNIYELDYFTERLFAMDAWQLDYFEGLVRMEKIKTQSNSVPLDLLINMTYSLEDCQVVHHVQTD